MSILLKKVKIIDLASPFHNQVLDVFIEKDQIAQIGENLDVTAKTVVNENGLCVSPGWFEMNSDFADPGYEHKENIDSGAKAAAFGGFTSVALTPNTQPIIQTKSDIEYLNKRSDEQAINIYPLGASTKNLEGKALTEMFDMYEAGAIGFYNGKKPVSNSNVQKLVFLYARTFGAPILVYPNQADISDGGQMNEGDASTYLALKGIPNLAEELVVNRDIYLAEYCDSPVHFTGISTGKSLELIKKAKEKGLQVTCSVNLYNLVLTDEKLKTYDTRYKVLPPLRTEKDRLALIEGLKDGTVDAISIDHIPQDIEVKKCEFDLAAFGMRGLETAVGIYGKHLAKQLGWDNWVNWISTAPREILNAPKIEINHGSIAELTLFHPEKEWNIDVEKLKPVSRNNPFYKDDLKGKAFGIVNKGKLVRN